MGGFSAGLGSLEAGGEAAVVVVVVVVEAEVGGRSVVGGVAGLVGGVVGGLLEVGDFMPDASVVGLSVLAVDDTADVDRDDSVPSDDMASRVMRECDRQRTYNYCDHRGRENSEAEADPVMGGIWGER